MDEARKKKLIEEREEIINTLRANRGFDFDMQDELVHEIDEYEPDIEPEPNGNV